ncbi:DUF4333 domain-containing protein [Alkalinema sp. FACHB-956]|uniref:DUF4333 domain-containing protein n=1 Tax=Alkalinema sp. FACHB-956 TaxID=2692768 RepID=UPI00168773CE|nr:DUF4333 domain-containing protein [Alkalinema sp. FACHB-956]MBD2329260.1 DUF4333 domain-containing protein [Alkalinema sp. FACHB-956]
MQLIKRMNLWGKPRLVLRLKRQGINPKRFKKILAIAKPCMVNQKSRRVFWGILLGITTILVSSCTKKLDTTKLEGEIQQQVTQQGGSSLKTVTCPKNIELLAEKGFECVGKLESGELFAIPIKQTDGQGTTTWEVSNTQGLLNLAQLESLFQETLQREGQSLKIDCGEGYRSVKPGDRFECKVAKSTQETAQAERPETSDVAKMAQATTGNQPKNPVNPKIGKTQVPETIVVTIDPQNNVNWQQVLPASTVQVASARLSGAEAKSANAAGTVMTTQDSLEKSGESPTTSKIAPEDRLKLSAEMIKDLDRMGGGDAE